MCAHHSTKGQRQELAPLQPLINIAQQEVSHEFDRKGLQGCLTDWLQGLGMGLDYMNYNIIQLAEKWHDCKLTEKEAEKITANWWSHIALKMIQFSREG